MRGNETKPFLTVPEQIDLLRSRGLTIPDDDIAHHWLTFVGYYRLSGYWYPYRSMSDSGAGRADKFNAGACFSQVIKLYYFDRDLRNLILEALEKIEVSLRSHVGHTLGRRDPLSHLDCRNLNPKFLEKEKRGSSKYSLWLNKVEELRKRSREDFVKHHSEKGGELLVWVMTEILDFGALSTLYQGMNRADRNEIAAAFGMLDTEDRGHGSALANQMHVLNFIRNVSAHHCRIWNRNMDIRLSLRNTRNIPQLSGLFPSNEKQYSRIFGALYITASLLKKISPNSDWSTRVTNLVTDHLPESGRSRSEMGFPLNGQLLPPSEHHHSIRPPAPSVERSTAS